jgi:hypothetical protein
MENQGMDRLERPTQLVSGGLSLSRDNSNQSQTLTFCAMRRIWRKGRASEKAQRQEETFSPFLY